MLKKILENKVCAECQMCCIFERYEVWETPVFNKETKDKLLKLKPDVEFISKDNGYITKVTSFDERGLFTCPALDKNKGCILGEEKPFDCKIWPFRIMEIGENRGITISNICTEMFNQPLAKLVDFLKEGLAKTIFEFADKNPEIVKPYDYSYPILILEEK